MYEMAKIVENISIEREAARQGTDKHPSEAQAQAGNYRKGKISFNGFLITIENPKGSYRRGKDKDGHEWKTLMHNDYGYFNRTVGKDGDAIDVFLGPNLKSEKIYPIDQFLNGEFDETKVMLGFNSAEEAKDAYLSNYEKDWKGFKYITEVNPDVFKKWLYDGYRQRKPFAKYARLTENKEQQLSIINDTNPMLDDYHTGIRKVEDIKTFEEAMAEAKADFDEYGYYSSYPDTPNSVLENALKTGKITVYSSKPISNGNFVTTSKMCASDYAGGGKVFSATLPTSDIAWINVEEGQVARLNKLNEEMSNRIYDAMEDYSHVDLLNEFLSDKRNGIPQKRWNLIPFEQYRNVRERFLREPQMARIPLNLVTSWFDIIIHNTLSISYITDFAGHSQYFPGEDLEEVFGVYADYSEGWKVLDKEGFYDWAKLPDGSDAWSDYGLSPLYKIISEYSENMEPGDVLMLIDRALDVGHCRGNLASAFIEGGSKSCDNITSKSFLNESPDGGRTYYYTDSDAYAFMKIDGEYYLSEPGESHQTMLDALTALGDITPVEGDDSILWSDTAGRYWKDRNILAFWDTPYDDVRVMSDAVNFLLDEIMTAQDVKTLLINVWDLNGCRDDALIPYTWFKNGMFEVFSQYNLRDARPEKDYIVVTTDKGTYFVDYDGNMIDKQYGQVSESKKRLRKNDEGENVPETCECGGKVCVQIHGEPVFICSKCGKYYGTLPFANESIDIRKALKRLKKRRDPANIENWDDMITESQGLKSKKLYDIFKQYGREFIANHYDSSEAMDLHNVSDDDVVGVFKAGQLPKNEGEEKKWAAQMGFSVDAADGIRNIKLGKTSEDGQILYAVVINRNANFDRTSVKKDGGFKDYVDKKNLRAAGRRSDGAKEYQWKDNDVKFDVMDNPYRKGWSGDAQNSLQDRMKSAYGNAYDKVKNVSEGKAKDINKEKQIDMVDEEMESIYTMKDWERDGSINIKAGQAVEDAVVNELKNCVPPATLSHGVFQVGEPTSHDWNTGQPLFATFERGGDNVWIYKGLEPIRKGEMWESSKGSGRKVYLTEAQFKAYCRQVLREKRNNDYLKKIISESISPDAIVSTNRAAYENACDCLYYGYGRDKWNSCGLEGVNADAVWNQAKEDMGNGLGRYGRLNENSDRAIVRGALNELTEAIRGME